MKKFMCYLGLCSLSAMNAAASATTLDDLDFTRQIANREFTAVPIQESNYAFVWAQRVKASYEFRSTGSGNLFQTLTVVFKPAYSKEARDQFLNAAGLQDRGVLEPFNYFRKDEISCKFSDEVLAYFAENQQPAPKVTTTVGGYPALCTLSVRVPSSWAEDLSEKLQQNTGLAFRAQPLLCRQDSPKVAMKDLLGALETKNVGQKLSNGDWRAPYLSLIYESVSLSLQAESIFAKNGHRKLWERFFREFTVNTAQDQATLPQNTVQENFTVCYDHPLEVTYVGAEAAAL